MSTRSFIAKEQGDGSYYGAYCHWDGYLTNNGEILLDNYSDAEKLEELLALGDISSLHEKVAPDPSRPHSFDESQADVTVAYGRDRGETDIDAREITLEQAKEAWCEYMYVYGRDGVWRYYDLLEEEPELRDVKTDLYILKTEQAQMQKSEPVM